MFVEPDGTFSVLEGQGSRFTYFGKDGNPVRTVQGPGMRLSYQGFRLALAWPRDDVFLGVPRIPVFVEVGWDGGTPLHRHPLVRVRRAASGQWLDPEPLLWLDFGNRTHAMRHPDGNPLFAAQPFGDPDHVRFEPGAAVLLRTGGVPGAVELIEVDGAGDTVWHRNLHFEPLKLTPRMVEEEVERIVDIMAPFHPQMSRPEVRDMFTEELHVPEYLPATEGPPVLAASGEVWLRTFEVSDTLRTHYVVRRGEADGAPRRVLLPEWLRVADATETHVWGVWWDSMDRPHVVGRKLILPR